jgi:hypothetical protein
MLRQNRSEGSSTSRSFAKTALLRARRKTFQFSDEHAHGTFSLRNHFSSFPRFRPRPRIRLTRSPHCFRGNHFSSCPSGRARRIETVSQSGCPTKPADRLAESRCAFLFRGNHFPSFLPAATDIQRNRDQACRRLRTLFPGNRFSSILPAETVIREARRSGSPHYFSREPLFLIPFGLTDAVGRAQRLSPAVSSSSSSQQGDNESLAVRKTDASVLRLLPPTS